MTRPPAHSASRGLMSSKRGARMTADSWDEIYVTFTLCWLLRAGESPIGLHAGQAENVGQRLTILYQAGALGSGTDSQDSSRSYRLFAVNTKVLR
jgi:hypothetical protein